MNRTLFAAFALISLVDDCDHVPPGSSFAYQGVAPEQPPLFQADALSSHVEGWEQLKQRWQAAGSPDLSRARLMGSHTLTHDANARDRFGAADPRTITSIEDLCALHRTIGGDGVIRTSGQQVSMGADRIRSYVRGVDVRERLLDALRQTQQRRPVPELAARLDHQLVSIHPFRDGNGRIARLVADALLTEAGYPPALHVMGAASTSVDPLRPWNHLTRITAGMTAAVQLAERV